MIYMLDTNICSYIIRQRPASVLERFLRLPGELISISAVTYAELNYGVEKSSTKNHNQTIIDAFVGNLQILSWNEAAARSYGRLRRGLELEGTPIGSMDLMIAAHAVSGGYTLVTNNLSEFKRVPGLSLENWV